MLVNKLEKKFSTDNLPVIESEANKFLKNENVTKSSISSLERRIEMKIKEMQFQSIESN